MRARAGRRRRARERGFTMIEVLVSMVLAAIAIVGLLALYMAETNAGGFSRHSTEASILAQDMVETLRTQGNAVAISNAVETGINERGVTGGIFTRTTNEVLQPTYASITVRVDWFDGYAHTITITAERDLP